jgi:hypothetical protein
MPIKFICDFAGLAILLMLFLSDWNWPDIIFSLTIVRTGPLFCIYAFL